MKRFLNAALVMISTTILDSSGLEEGWLPNQGALSIQNVLQDLKRVLEMKRIICLRMGIAPGLVILSLTVMLLVPMHRAFGLSNVDTTHNGTGMLIYRLPSSELGWVCSGILIAPQVFLTAGHCTNDVQSWLNRGLIQAAYVSFDPLFTQSASLVNITSLITDPGFNFLYNINSDTHDLGVVLLAEPVSDRPYTSLPTTGLLDSLLLPPETPVIAVGYGIDSNNKHGAPSPGFSYTDTGVRASGILLKRALTHAFITVTQLANQGSDNLCFGDSGGPDFIVVDDQEQLVAINVVVNSYSCEEVAWLYRLDTPQARAFLGRFVILP